MKRLLPGLVLLTLLGCSAPRIVVKRAPPPDRNEGRDAKPGADYFWKKGHWVYSASIDEFTWEPGRWEKERTNRIWIPGSWQPEGEAWVWHEGDWEERGRESR